MNIPGKLATYSTQDEENQICDGTTLSYLSYQQTSDKQKVVIENMEG
jgi:hypothetical protein